MRNFIINYKSFYIYCKSEHFYYKFVFFTKKRDAGHKYRSFKQKRIPITTSERKSYFNHHRVDHVYHSLKGGMPPGNDSCNLPSVYLTERLYCISLMPYDVGRNGDSSGFFKSVSHQLYGTE